MAPECPIVSEGNCEFGRRYRKGLKEEGSVPYKLGMASSPGSVNPWPSEITGSNYFTISTTKQASLSVSKRPALACMRP